MTLYHFPAEPMVGDVDSIIKLVLDACSRHVYVDDIKVERIVVQKFEPDPVFAFSEPTPALAEAVSMDKPVLCSHIERSF